MTRTLLQRDGIFYRCSRLFLAVALLLQLAAIRETIAEETTNEDDAEALLASNREFLATKAQESGIRQTESGRVYRILQRGTGKYHPQMWCPVLVEYAGSCQRGGHIFDSSYERGVPLKVAPGQVMTG